MPKIILVMFLMLFTVMVNAQIYNPVTWTHTAVKIADKTYELHLTASIAGNWHMYAQDAGEGPEPTTIHFITNPLISLDGNVKETGDAVRAYDKYFRSATKYYEKKVDFVQKLSVRSSIATVVKGAVSFMVCNDRQCLSPKVVPFSITVGGK